MLANLSKTTPPIPFPARPPSVLEAYMKVSLIVLVSSGDISQMYPGPDENMFIIPPVIPVQKAASTPSSDGREGKTDITRYTAIQPATPDKPATNGIFLPYRSLQGPEVHRYISLMYPRPKPNENRVTIPPLIPVKEWKFNTPTLHPTNSTIPSKLAINWVFLPCLK